MAENNTYSQLSRYISQIASSNLGLSASIKPVLDEQEQIFKSFSKDVKLLVASLQPTTELLKTVSVSMSAWSEIIQSSLSSTAMESIAGLTKHATNFFTEEFLERIEKLPARLQKALFIFAENGWYFDLEMSPEELWGLEEAFTEGRVEEAEDVLSKYFESRLDAIESSIKEKYSHRSVLITEAFEAHKKGKYSLSILALFAQTDGICKEVFGQNLFCGGKRFESNKYVEQITYDSLHEALISPLKQRMPVNLNQKERDIYFKGLNRHMVMHGESLDYGTKINSLKAVSIFNYIAKVIGKD